MMPEVKTTRRRELALHHEAHVVAVRVHVDHAAWFLVVHSDHRCGYRCTLAIGLLLIDPRLQGAGRAAPFQQLALGQLHEYGQRIAAKAVSSTADVQ